MTSSTAKRTLIARLREEAAVREGDLAALRERLAAAEHELDDLRAIRDALTPPELPRPRAGTRRGGPARDRGTGQRRLLPGVRRAQDSTVLVVGDVLGHGLQAARRAAFIRTTFAATAPWSGRAVGLGVEDRGRELAAARLEGPPRPHMGESAGPSPGARRVAGGSPAVAAAPVRAPAWRTLTLDRRARGRRHGPRAGHRRPRARPRQARRGRRGGVRMAMTARSARRDGGARR
jgi:hypothetical protein